MYKVILPLKVGLQRQLCAQGGESHNFELKYNTKSWESKGWYSPWSYFVTKVFDNRRQKYRDTPSDLGQNIRCAIWTNEESQQYVCI